MTNSPLGLLVGGVVPALLFGLFAIFTKASSQHFLASSPYLIVLGLSIALVGVASGPILGTGIGNLTSKGIGFGMLAGILWGLGMLLVSIALNRLGTPISVLTPLYNMNTLVAVLLGLWIFSEWKEVQALPLILGAVLITAGGILVARA